MALRTPVWRFGLPEHALDVSGISFLFHSPILALHDVNPSRTLSCRSAPIPKRQRSSTRVIEGRSSRRFALGHGQVADELACIDIKAVSDLDDRLQPQAALW
jgi:hypothetical protein